MRALASLRVRLLAWNVLLVFLPAGGVLLLDTYERQLLRDQERTMVQQGRVLGAALSGRGALVTEDVRRALAELHQRSEARIRVLDPHGRVLADSSLLGGRAAARARLGADPSARAHWLYTLASWPLRTYRAWRTRGEPPLDDAGRYAGRRVLDGPEVAAALAGRYGAATRISSGGQRSLTLYSAIPVRTGARVMGAVLVSQSTYQILQKLYALRLDVLRVLLACVTVAVAVSLVLSRTIARPIGRLRDQAEVLLDRRGRLSGRFGAQRRRDEIGDLARSLEGLRRRLEERLGAVEAFASDVSHELRNPLASIRSATELALELDHPGERKRMGEIVLAEIARVERLLVAIRELGQLDAGAASESRVPLDLEVLLQRLASSHPRVTLARPEPSMRFSVAGSADELTRVFENLLENAESLSPPDAPIEIELAHESHSISVRILDRGPGIPPAHRERIFERFFSFRPDAAPDECHTGLGLAIARTIVEHHDGTLAARSRPGGGTVFELRLPSAA